MAWSTRELAEQAGTTVNTVRHYHRLGLLDEPERESNGYKQYGVQHLVSLLRIRRLADLGVPLSQIRDARPGADSTPQTLRELDVGLQDRIRRLEAARADIAAALRVVIEPSGDRSLPITGDLLQDSTAARGDDENGVET